MSEGLTSTAELTAQLRWLKRIEHPTEDKEKLMKVLQQAWNVTEYIDGVQSGVTTEWRDVPIETEESSVPGAA